MEVSNISAGEFLPFVSGFIAGQQNFFSPANTILLTAGYVTVFDIYILKTAFAENPTDHLLGIMIIATIHGGISYLGYKAGKYFRPTLENEQAN